METWNADVNSLLYQPLEGELPLRLLRLGAGRPGQPIECELVPTDLGRGEAVQDYEATSYTWGSPEHPPTIACNGVGMKVQRSVFDMLNGIRYPDRQRMVWIDAICIDQSNVDERSAQVSMMGEVYRRAKNVLVWLGPPDAHSKVAMDYARTLDHAALVKEYMAVVEAPGDVLMESAFQSKTYFFDEPDQTESFKECAFAILRFLQRPWFNRVWVQQEAVLCLDTRVFCGGDCIAWDQLFSLAWVMHPRQAGGYPRYIHDMLGTVFHNLSALLEIQKFRGRLHNDIYGVSRKNIYLLQTLASARRFGATDPRDKIFALKNLATDANDWVEVDYRVPWQIIYLEVAQKCLRHGWLEFLEAAGRSRHEPGSVLPSWAPDYRECGDREFPIREHPLWMPGGGIPGLGMPRADFVGTVHQLPKSHRRKFSIPQEIKSFKGSQKQLLQSYVSIKCTMSDEIVYLSKVYDEVSADREDPSTSVYPQIIDEDLQHLKTLDSQTYLNNESVYDAYKLTFMLGRDAEGNIVDSSYVQENWDDWILWMNSGSPDEWKGECRPPILEPCFRASNVADQYRFAITKHGYFCIVTCFANIHDEVAILPGYSLGVVIRPWSPSPGDRFRNPKGKEGNGISQNSDTEYHEFVGDAYIHGMMRNEAQCIIDEFGCKHKPSESQWGKIARASDSGKGEGWETFGFSGNYSRVLPTLGLRRVKLV
ncbi:hypothetical protein SLS62_001781 [Diatrype stigma]|uniref:Heterokaryon incompatibility domain-containing protein n=1 Tax=Diatrype stigma TaxID=117547 RepID=A0AAN9V9U6_9PEZI